MGHSYLIGVVFTVSSAISCFHGYFWPSCLSCKTITVLPKDLVGNIREQILSYSVKAVVGVYAFPIGSCRLRRGCCSARRPHVQTSSLPQNAGEPNLQHRPPSHARLLMRPPGRPLLMCTCSSGNTTWQMLLMPPISLGNLPQ